MENKLTLARKKISEVDRKIADLFEERMRASEDVADYKRKCGLPIEDPVREDELIKKNSSLVPEDIRPYYIGFQRDIMKASKAYQRRLIEGEKIAYCGEEGAFAFFTAKKLFPDSTPVAKNSFEEAYDSVSSGECELAVIPLENSYAGEVGQVTDMLFSGSLCVNAVNTQSRCLQKCDSRDDKNRYKSSAGAGTMREVHIVPRLGNGNGAKHFVRGDEGIADGR